MATEECSTRRLCSSKASRIADFFFASQVHVAISESYPEFVRSGLVSVISGRVMALEASESGDALARVQKADGEDVIEVSLPYYRPLSPRRSCSLTLSTESRRGNICDGLLTTQCRRDAARRCKTGTTLRSQ